MYRAQNRDQFTVEKKLAVRQEENRRATPAYDQNIVHFCGHGSGDEGTAFEDDNWKAILSGADALYGFFALFADKAECVVLTACHSEIRAEAIVKYIPCVMGIKKVIGDAAATEFAVAFYDALGAGESIEFAYKPACNAIPWKGILEYLTPTLKLKAK